MRILGIDPGLRLTGYGLVEAAGPQMALVASGVIRTDLRKELSARLCDLHTRICEILAHGRPVAVALEDLFVHSAFPRTAITMGHVCGVIHLAAAQSGVPVETIPPAAVKSAIATSGRAGKRQVQRMVRVLLGLAEEPGAHVGDALALAVVALSRRGMRGVGALRPVPVAPPTPGLGLRREPELGLRRGPGRREPKRRGSMDAAGGAG